ncbi:MAG: hypothetical protein M5U28_21705 [Sandaracinaceae bacterium]|nr:hypothetical protein [Sandaracinaceae bacterium]
MPYGAYWSTPFCRWQGRLAGEHAIALAAGVGRSALAARGVDPAEIDAVHLGTTVPQLDAFYGAPWLAGMLGIPTVTGPTLSQACATSVRTMVSAALEVEAGQRRCVLAVTCDRTSNGPHLYYPDPSAPGGRGTSTDWVWDAFSRDPYAENAMIETAERVAAAQGLGRAAQDEVTLLRYAQYADALADDRAFQRRYMVAAEVGRGGSASR